MKFAMNDKSAQGAMIRTILLKQPRPGDAAVIEKAAEETLEKLSKKPSFHGDMHGGMSELFEYVHSQGNGEAKEIAGRLLTEELDDDGTAARAHDHRLRRGLQGLRHR